MQIENGDLVVALNGVDITVPLPAVTEDAKVKAWAVPVEYRENGIFVSVTELGQDEELPACNLADTQFIGEIMLESGEDAKLENAKSLKLIEINNAFSSAMSDLVTKYPEYEIKSWPQQVKEAEAYNADPESVTPLLTAIAAERSITVAELVTKILVNRDLYAASAGALIGRRHAAEDLVELAVTEEDVLAVLW